jgi:hypothetical protein
MKNLFCYFSLIVFIATHTLSGAVIKVIPVDIGLSDGRLGLTAEAPLANGDVVGLEIILNDTYTSDAVGLSLTVSGNASLSVDVATIDKAQNPLTYDITFDSHIDVGIYSVSGAYADNPVDITEKIIGRLEGTSFIFPMTGETTLFSGPKLTIDGTGEIINIDLSSLSGRYSDATVANVSFANDDLDDLVLYTEGSDTSPPDTMTIKKLTLTAGKKREYMPTDNIMISGLLDGDIAEAINSEEARESGVSIAIGDASGDLFNDTLVITDKHLKKNTFKYKGQKGEITRCNINTKTNRFLLIGKKLTLSGITSPISLSITFGSFSATDTVDEAIINGPKKTLSPYLQSGVTDTLTITKAKVTGRTDNNILIVSGTITAGDFGLDIDSEIINVHWDLHHETLDIDPFKQGNPNKRRYVYKKTKNNPDGKVRLVMIDLDTCKFKTIIKGTTLANISDLFFGISTVSSNYSVTDTKPVN